MAMKTRTPRRGVSHVRRPQYSRRFGLSADAVHPLFGEPVRGRPAVAPGPRVDLDCPPSALALYPAGASRFRRLLARLGTSRTVVLGPHGRPVALKGLVSVSAGALVGMMAAQPFDALTFVAPLYGLVAGATAAGVGWRAVRGRRALTIDVEQWRPQLDAIGRILSHADRIGQPFVSPPALRAALHGALWHAVGAVDQPGGDEVLATFDAQLGALGQATETTLLELESPSITQRKAEVSERLAAVVGELELASADPPVGACDP